MRNVFVRLPETQTLNSYENTKNTLRNALENNKYKVLALEGPWGIGKTFLLTELVRENQNNEIYSSSLYVSMIGVKSIEILKTKILGRIWSGYVGKFPVLNCFTSQYVINEAKVASTVLGSVGISWFKEQIGISLADSVVLALPKYLTCKVVVIDDVERVMESISLSELFGFINEYSEMYGTRFVILLNEKELPRQDEWRTYFEKIVDRKIVLNPSVDSLVNISKPDNDLPYIECTKQAMKEIKINSIRVIDKIFDMMHEIFVGKLQEGDDFFEKIIPVGVLISAIYHKAIKSDIPINYVLSRYRHDLRSAGFEDNDIYNEVLKRLNITSYVRLSEVFVKFLDYGVVDTKLTNEILDELRSNAREQALRNKLNAFFMKVNWTKGSYLPALEAEALQLSRRFTEINHMDVSFLHYKMKELGLKNEATSLINDWVQMYEYKWRNNESYTSLNIFGDQGIHPFILSMDAKLIEEKKLKPSISEAVNNMSSESGHSQSDSDKVNSATVNDIQMEIMRLDGEDLKNFVNGNFEHLDFKRNANRIAAYEKFKAACHGIIEKNTCHRTTAILKREFENRGLF